MLNEYQKAALEFIKESAPSVPVANRIKIYRGAADLVNEADDSTRENFIAKANILEEAEKRCNELNLTFGGAE
jgi:hypothetical protein